MLNSKKGLSFSEFLVFLCLVANNVVIKSSRPKKSGMIEDLLQVLLFELFQPFEASVEVPDELDDDLAYTMSSDTEYRMT